MPAVALLNGQPGGPCIRWRSIFAGRFRALSPQHASAFRHRPQAERRIAVRKARQTARTALMLAAAASAPAFTIGLTGSAGRPETRQFSLTIWP